MAASATDYFSKAYQRLSTTLSADKLSGATSMTLSSVTNWPTTTGIKACVYTLDSNGNISTSTFCVYRGTISGSTINNLTLVEGTDQLHSAGAIVSLLFTATHWNDAMTGLAVSHNQDGTMISSLPLTTPKITTSINDANGVAAIVLPATASAVNQITVTDAATGVAPSISASGTDSAVNLNLRGKGLAKTVTIGAGATTIFPYDYVVSGCVLSGTGYGTTLAWSMTSGVVVINGNPITVASNSGTVTASKDTYFDVLDAGDGTGTLVFTGGNSVANNAASPALASNSIRIGIIVSGAGSIAAATSVNQGQEDRVLPIASSIPYAVTDSLGNLICPRDPQRKTVGYRQAIANQGSITTVTDLTGLSVPFIADGISKYKVTLETSFSGTVAGDLVTASIKEGATVLDAADVSIASTSGRFTTYMSRTITPTAGLHTYKATLERLTGTGTITNDVNKFFPAIFVERA